jgi:hypothetical protein
MRAQGFRDTCIVRGLLIAAALMLLAAATISYAVQREEIRTLTKLCKDISSVADSCCHSAETATHVAQQCVHLTVDARSVEFTKRQEHSADAYFR